MISRPTLLADLQRLLKKLEIDLRTRSEEMPDIDAKLKAQHAQAVKDKRTGATFPEWREELITQVGVAWILGCVFVRFLEDNAFIDAPLISGPGERLGHARDAHTAYVRGHATDSDREYLLHVFATVAKLPVLSGLFDAKHNPLWLFGPSADGAQELLTFWRQTDPATGTLLHDFTDSACDTRFLGDLYQDLSESARKRYALLQTPVFVEEFILDRTLEPAIRTFGLAKVRMIDPTCGSGHFVLGGFHRLLDHWQKTEPGINIRELVRRALDAVYGIDLNPYAVAIARFRLLLAALRAAKIDRVRSAPELPLHIATGDSLLFGPEPGQEVAADLLASATDRAFITEDAEIVTRFLCQRYHAVVGNPPYITVSDKVLKAAYKRRFRSCHRLWVLTLPFFERFFDLAVKGNGTSALPAGFIGKITGNSFMKREFGKKLVEDFIPRWDITHVIDTGGAYLPGHGTPTVIILGRNSHPIADTIRTVMGIKGEPSTPEDPAQGFVWKAIESQIDRPGTQSEFISVADTARASFEKHPWSIGGGGAAELKDTLDEISNKSVMDFVELPIGRAVRIAEEEAFEFPSSRRRNSQIPKDQFRGYQIGENVRDWCSSTEVDVWYPYSACGSLNRATEVLWPWRTVLANRTTFQGKMSDAGLEWYDYQQHTASAYLTPLSISFSEVATHNHFVLDRGGRVFKQTAPVIKLPARATEDDHLGLLGLLNSSVACFWLKQVCHNKGSTVDEHGARQRTAPFEDFFQFNGTKIGQMPLSAERPLELARALNRLAFRLQSNSPAAVLSDLAKHSRAALEATRTEWFRTLMRMITLQEELDWAYYAIYGLVDAKDAVRLTLENSTTREGVPDLSLGQRAFEIVLARRIAVGEEQSSWFDRHRSTPITAIPSNWPTEYRAVVERRIQLIESNRNIGLIERPEFKRRWNVEPWDGQLTSALRAWLLERLEAQSHWLAVELASVHQIAERARTDAGFMRVAELYAGRPDFDLAVLVSELVSDESVPSLPGQRYKDSGLRKYSQWEETWDKQRKEDAITARILKGKSPAAAEDPAIKQEIKTTVAAEVGDILVPPKYSSGDFQKSSFWRLRGKLDVPKERFVSYPGAERTIDSSLVIAWAGWDHLQQAQAIAAHFQKLKDDGAPEAQLTCLLASLHQLLPWLLQWHNDLDPVYHERMGDFYRTYVEDEARRLHLTADDLKTLANTRS